MKPQLHQRYCSFCRRRPRDEGGSGTCPLDVRDVRDRLRKEREDNEGRACLSYKVGDYVPKAVRQGIGPEFLKREDGQLLPQDPLF